MTGAEEVNAIYRLVRMRELNPELAAVEAKARLELAAAIIAMDEAANRPGHHNFNEQARVEEAKTAYAQALADLVRGESA